MGSDETIDRIEDLYERQDISRVDPNASRTTKSGVRRNMNMTIEVAHKIFLKENPDVQVSYCKFYLLKPDNVKKCEVTKLQGCLCAYCQNVSLKLAKLNHPTIKTAYDLYDMLICAKEDGTRFRDSKF